jgi:hypothetical protein
MVLNLQLLKILYAGPGLRRKVQYLNFAEGRGRYLGGYEVLSPPPCLAVPPKAYVGTFPAEPAAINQRPLRPAGQA